MEVEFTLIPIGVKNQLMQSMVQTTWLPLPEATADHLLLASECGIGKGIPNAIAS